MRCTIAYSIGFRQEPVGGVSVILSCSLSELKFYNDNLFFGAEEDDKTWAQRLRPHINLGRWGGEHVSLDFQGSLLIRKMREEQERADRMSFRNQMLMLKQRELEEAETFRQQQRDQWENQRFRPQPGRCYEGFAYDPSHLGGSSDYGRSSPGDWTTY